jgi:hypothetical protein
VKRGPAFLLERIGKLTSRVGGFVPGSHATFRGEDLHRAFGDTEWVDLYLFAVTGRRFTPAQRRLLQSLWVYTSYPDARLWNNRVAALAGTARSTGNLGIAAALAVSEASVYGRGVDIRASAFLQKTLRDVALGVSVGHCIRREIDLQRRIAGYGRPLVSKDERIEPTLELAAALELDRGPHLGLAFEIDRYLADHRFRLKINYAAVAAALTADMGMTPREHYLYGFPAFLAGMVPCYLEAVDEPPAARFPIPCEDVVYGGSAPRSWARRRGNT